MLLDSGRGGCFIDSVDMNRYPAPFQKAQSRTAGCRRLAQPVIDLLHQVRATQDVDATGQAAIDMALQLYLEEQAMQLVGLTLIQPWLQACFIEDTSSRQETA